MATKKPTKYEENLQALAVELYDSVSAKASASKKRKPRALLAHMERVIDGFIAAKRIGVEDISELKLYMARYAERKG